MLNVFILKNIRDHLINNPGVFSWSPKAELWNVSLDGLYENLKFLRINGFIRNDYGRTYWIKGEFQEVKVALKKERSDQSTPKQQQTAFIETDLVDCIKEMNSMIFVGLNIAEVTNRLSKSYPSAIVHRAVVKSGGRPMFSLNCPHVLYYKFSGNVSC